MTPAKNRGHRGFALISVMALGAVAMLALTSLLGDGTVAERRLQEAELLKLRAYWAGQGQLSYVISRSLQGPPCGGSCNNGNARRNYLRDVVDELYGGASSREWAYTEIDATYSFPVDLNIISGNALAQWTISYPNPVTTHSLIQSNWPPLRAPRITVCHGLTDVSLSCSNTNTDKSSGIIVVLNIEPDA